MDRFVRKVEGIAMPLEDFLRQAYVAKQRISFCSCCRRKIVPTDFFDAAGVDPSAESVGDGLFELDALPNEAWAATRARVAEVLGGAPVAELW